MAVQVNRLNKSAGRNERREYMRKYRSENKERIKAYNEAYWQRKAAQRLKLEAESHAENSR